MDKKRTKSECAARVSFVTKRGYQDVHAYHWIIAGHGQPIARANCLLNDEPSSKQPKALQPKARGHVKTSDRRLDF